MLSVPQKRVGPNTTRQKKISSSWKHTKSSDVDWQPVGWFSVFYLPVLSAPHLIKAVGFISPPITDNWVPVVPLNLLQLYKQVNYSGFTHFYVIFSVLWRHDWHKNCTYSVMFWHMYVVNWLYNQTFLCGEIAWNLFSWQISGIQHNLLLYFVLSNLAGRDISLRF